MKLSKDPGHDRRGTRWHARERQDLEASLALFRSCDEPAGVATCLAHMAFAEAWREGFEAAVALSEGAIRFAERSADDDALALTVRALIPARYEDAASRARGSR